MAFNILIVDDSSIVRKVLIKALGMSSLQVGEIFEASHGLEGLAALREKWVDLVLLDINMPVMDGLQFMEQLRSDEALKTTQVVIVSTEGSKERRQRLSELGVSAYLRKPVTPEQLTETVTKVLGEQRS